MTPHREDFARWLDDPVTRWVMAAHAAVIEDAKQTWVNASWDNGGGSRDLLIELRSKADAYAQLQGATYEDICAQLGEAPNDE